MSTLEDPLVALAAAFAPHAAELLRRRLAAAEDLAGAMEQLSRRPRAERLEALARAAQVVLPEPALLASRSACERAPVRRSLAAVCAGEGGSEPDAGRALLHRLVLEHLARR